MTQRKSLSGNKNGVTASVLPVRIQPRASKNEIVTMENGGLKIRLTAPPIDGAANDALIALLAKRLEIAKSRVKIVSGHTGREKIIMISGMNEIDVKQALNKDNK